MASHSSLWEMWQLNGVVLITGGSSGIGSAIAEKAGDEGYPVCINYCKSDRAALKLKEKLEAKNYLVKTVKSDISTEDGVNTLFKEVDSFGRLHALVNNAGIISKMHEFHSFSFSQLQKVFQVNVFGSFLCAREAVKRMSKNFGGQGGCIVNISSIASRLGSPNEFIDYAASKGAIDTFTTGL